MSRTHPRAPCAGRLDIVPRDPGRAPSGQRPPCGLIPPGLSIAPVASRSTRMAVELGPVLEEREPLVLDAPGLEQHADAVDVLEQLVATRGLEHPAGLVHDVGDHPDLVQQRLRRTGSSAAARARSPSRRRPRCTPRRPSRWRASAGTVTRSASCCLSTHGRSWCARAPPSAGRPRAAPRCASAAGPRSPSAASWRARDGSMPGGGSASIAARSAPSSEVQAAREDERRGLLRDA